MTHRQMSCKSFVAEANDSDGTIDKIVSVFGNVDYAGDRAVHGCFAASLSRWSTSDGPIPVIFSHQWNVLEAHVGVVEDAKELAPGDPLLPTQLAEYGGLWVRERYDMDQPFAARLHELQKQRRIKESSFAYDVIKERRASDGANDLLELDIIEVGPTLKGMNPETVVIDAKTRAAAEAAAGQKQQHTDPAADADQTGEPTTDSSAPDDTVVEPGNDEEPDAEDPPQTADDQPDGAKATPGTAEPATPPGRKAQVTLDASYEQLQQRLDDAISAWAAETYNSYEVFCAYLEATYAETIVIYVELWSEPLGGGSYLQAGYTIAADGTVTLADPEPVEVTGVVTPKALPQQLRDRKSAAIAAGGAPDPNQPADAPTAKSVLAALDVGLIEA